MPTPTIAEGNKIIAEFDGWRFMKLCGLDGEEKIPLYQKFDKNGECIHPGVFHQPDYSNNWNSLMGVVQKLKDYVLNEKPYDNLLHKLDVLNLYITAPIETVFEQTVYAIEYINQNK